MSYYPNERPRRYSADRTARTSIPGAKEWRGYELDLDVKYAHKLFLDKSIPQAVKYFGGWASIERADELLFMPRAAFQYYVMAFSEFVKSSAAIGDSDSASCFLRLLCSREKKDPGSVAEIYAQLSDTVHFVASRQGRFEASPHIYGRFRELADELLLLVKPA